MENLVNLAMKLNEEESIYFLYGYRNFFSPKTLMDSLGKLSKEQDRQTNER